MSKIGFFDYLKQAGKVKLHSQNSLSDTTYKELQSAQKMIRNYIKNCDLRVDIYDANTLPNGEKIPGGFANRVRVEVNHLLDDKIVPKEFSESANTEPILRQIFSFIDEQCGKTKSPIKELIDLTKTKYNHYLKTNKSKTSQTINSFV